MGNGYSTMHVREQVMRISLIGGIDRLQKHYREEAEKLGVDLRIFNTSETNLPAKIRHAEAVVIFTSKVSHKARREVMGVALANSIPVFMCHNCGICALRDCLNCVKGSCPRPEAEGGKPLAFSRFF
jgi:hypothetical protein